MARRWVRRGLRWIEGLLLVAAAVCVAWVYLAWKDASFYQVRAKGQLVRMLASADLPEDAVRASAPAPNVRDDSLIGVLDIPRLGVAVAVLEGEDNRTLRLAVGHVPGTPMPWDEGNSALAGHRDTFFRPLEHVRVGDEMALATRRGKLQYRVRRVVIVGPDDVSVLTPADGISLTLITCYPFGYLGDAPQRFVVQAERSTSDPREATHRAEWSFLR